MIVLAAVTGYRLGLAARAISWAGGLVGLGLSAILVPKVLDAWPGGDAVTRLRAKLDADNDFPAPDTRTNAPDSQESYDRAIAELEREARTTNDRARLGLLVREIETLQRRRGTPELALPWL